MAPILIFKRGQSSRAGITAQQHYPPSLQLLRRMFNKEGLLPSELIEDLQINPIEINCLPVIAANYRELVENTPSIGQHFYAVKANSRPQVLRLLANMGASFDVATVGELGIIKKLGISAGKIIWSNTSKSDLDAEEALAYGLRKFVTHVEEDVGRIADAAKHQNIDPKSVQITTRVQAEPGPGAYFSHMERFGIHASELEGFLDNITAWGMTPAGIHLHHGSENKRPAAWDATLISIKLLYERLRKKYPTLDTINLSGGYAGATTPDSLSLAQFAAQMNAIVEKHFGDEIKAGHLKIVDEPGRSIVASSATIFSEIIEIKPQQVPSSVGGKEIRLQITTGAGLLSAGLNEPGLEIMFGVAENGKLRLLDYSSQRSTPEDENIGISLYDRASGGFKAMITDDKKNPEVLRLPKQVAEEIQQLRQNGQKVVTCFCNTGAYLRTLRTQFNGQSPPWELLIRDMNDPHQKPFERTVFRHSSYGHFDFSGDEVIRDPRAKVLFINPEEKLEMEIMDGQDFERGVFEREDRRNRAAKMGRMNQDTANLLSTYPSGPRQC